METVFSLLLLAGVALFWTGSLRARERATRACAEACAGVGAQLLDQTVALSRVRPARDRAGRAVLRRAYVFEFSLSGGQRCRGRAWLLGSTLESIEMDCPPGVTLWNPPPGS